jgi:uridylate kinase
LRIAIKLGGHLFPLKLDPEKISSYTEILRKLAAQGHQIVVVAGGGEVSRKYISAARKLGATEALCDELGIEVARLNAQLLIIKLGEEAYPKPPSSNRELRLALASGKIVILGGLHPGQSTNAVAAMAAEEMRADLLINATNVDGVYSADPKKDPQAKFLSKIESSKLIDLLLSKSFGAGGYELFDMVAIKIVERSKIPTVIIDGRKPENIMRVIHGEKLGTHLIYD